MTSRSLGAGVVTLVMLCVARGAVVAQANPPPRSLLQLEVGDSIGLPLPDAKLEVYTLMERATFREWVAVEPWMLPQGTHLLRISNPGFEPAVVSVPLRKGGAFSLRVRLQGPRDVVTPNGDLDIGSVGAIGISVSDRTRRDVIGKRRVVVRDAIERSHASSITDVVRRLKSKDLLLTPAGGGYEIRGVWDGGATGCILPMIANGDPRFSSSFTEVDHYYEVADVEAIEILPGRTAEPYMLNREMRSCGLVIVWTKGN